MGTTNKGISNIRHWANQIVRNQRIYSDNYENISRYNDSNKNGNDRKVDAIQKVLLQVLDPENRKDFETELSD